MKRKIFVFCFLLWAVTAVSAEIRNARAMRKDLLENARKLMLQGRRREALEKLTALQELGVIDKERGPLLFKKKMFSEQFLFADSFEKYQSARSAEEAGNWSDCLAELEGVGGGDQDNVLVLLTKARCEALGSKFENSERSYMQVLALFPECVDAQLGLIEGLLLQKDITKALPLLNKLKPLPKNSKEAERQTLVRAQALEIQGKKQEALDLLRKDYDSSYGAGERPGVLLRLGLAYYRKSEEGSIENAWQARKYLALYTKRCSTTPTFDCKKAEETLARLDKKLNQQPK